MPVGAWQRLAEPPGADDSEERGDVDTPTASAPLQPHCHRHPHHRSGSSEPSHWCCLPGAGGHHRPSRDVASGLAGHDTPSSTSDSLCSQREAGGLPRAANPLKRLQTARLRVSAMCCDLEVGLVRERLEAMPGVVRVTANVVGQRVVVRYDAAAVDIGAMVAALNADHLGCTVQESGGAGEAPEPLLGRRLAAYYAGLVGLFAASAGCWAALAGPRPRLAAAAVAGFLLYASPPVMYVAWFSLRRCKLDISTLVLVSAASTVALDDMFDACLLMFLFGMARLCERLCLGFVQRRLAATNVPQPGSVVLAEPGHKGEVLPIDDVPIGTLLSLRPGDQVPLDGTVVEGCMSVDESALTGEATPVAKGKGDSLHAGTVAQNGYLEMRTTAVAAESTAARIQRLVEEGQAEASHTAVLVDRFASYYTPSLLLLAVVLLVATAILGTGPDALSEGLHTALLILVLACPCSLVMATPIATVCAVAAAAQAQVVVKTGGLALDRLAALDVVALDKTGTLTEGALKVTDELLLWEPRNGEEVEPPVAPCPSVGPKSTPHSCSSQRSTVGPPHCCAEPAQPRSGGDGAAPRCCGPAAAAPGPPLPAAAHHAHPHEAHHHHHHRVMRAVAALEAASSHPLAAALIGHYCRVVCGGCLGTAQREVAALPSPVDVTVHPGKGLQGTVEGAAVAVGNRQLMEQLGVGGLAEANSRWQAWELAAKTVVFVSIDGRLELLLGLADRPRAEAAATVDRLRHQGLAVVMLTGDTPACAAAVGAAAGVAEVEAGLRPEDKQRWVAERQGRGQAVCMVGDGINDGPALSQADVGVAMGAGGTALATQAADVILLSDRLALLPAVYTLARRCRIVVWLNIATAVLLKLAVLVASFCVTLPLWLAIVADAVALGVVLGLGLTLLAPLERQAWRSPPPTPPSPCDV